jgi:hypothetical protein
MIDLTLKDQIGMHRALDECIDAHRIPMMVICLDNKRDVMTFTNLIEMGKPEMMMLIDKLVKFRLNDMLFEEDFLKPKK